MAEVWATAVREAIERRAPELLQALKDDHAGMRRLSASRRKAARVILSKVMTEAEIEEALAAVPVGAHEPAPKSRRV